MPNAQQSHMISMTLVFYVVYLLFVQEEEKKKQDERERIAREKRYTLPEAPHIVVHPSRTAKSGKFDCTVMSLSLLLDYRPEDTKVHNTHQLHEFFLFRVCINNAMVYVPAQNEIGAL
jgi:hypothetical protein